MVEEVTALKVKDYLGYENARNKAHAATYERFLRAAFGRDVKLSVLVGHHICFEVDGDLNTENEIPSADTLMFDHELMGKVFGEQAGFVMGDLARAACDKRDDLLLQFMDSCRVGKDHQK